ncbi:uncharacterized protein LODBEIA_P43870 [Lodderomyces beijingensis]|uniref:Endonuclease/exonuclease/phosphatase domain-containing protein n=1 Tax=Lodderomyces beijingensis TaxID=1775926 RepID=A0ABP0ZPS6_9ASCO
MEKVLSQEPFTKIPVKNDKAIRFVTFNVNGVKTIFHYHPWNHFNNDLNAMFNSLNADIITLQELKLTASTMNTMKNIGHLSDFRSFISLPAKKKGYSGVGLFVRIPKTEAQKKGLTVVKAEEGVTGWLRNRAGKRYRDGDGDGENSIGGYSEEIAEEQALEIDSEGRCVVVELASNCVVFALYCPANSSATEHGEKFRLDFLSCLLKRCHYLKFHLKKDVVIMGDINVSLDLIDNAEAISERLVNQQITDIADGHAFEVQNYEECCKFKESRESRNLMNKYVFRSLWQQLRSFKIKNHFLYDTTRYIQGRRRNMYTVWNTLTSSRSVNYGSRIDLILCSSYGMISSISKADIWPFILGSDHCPVFTDFDILDNDDSDEQNTDNDTATSGLGPGDKLLFEAKNHYKLNKSRDISTLFGARARSPPESESETATTSTSEDGVSLQSQSQSQSRSPTSARAGKTKRPREFTYSSRKTAKPNPQKTINRFFS